MSKKGKKVNTLGKQLIRDRFGPASRRKVDNDTMLHTTEVQDGYDWGRLNLSSITEESSFQEFLRSAELAGTEFQAEKLNINYVIAKQSLPTETENAAMRQKHKDHIDELKIPRRPTWTRNTSAEELHQAENDNFLEWRRNMALLQEEKGILMTPYEKNLEFWRQLWRVVERSDVVVQIVDARNPLLFRSLDLERYVNEINPRKTNVILLNKSDLLTEKQRNHWARYFDSQGIRTAFFSAFLAEEELKRELAVKNLKTNEANNKQPVQTPSDLRLAAVDSKNSVTTFEENMNLITSKLESIRADEKDMLNNPNVLTREELIEFFRNIYKGQTFTQGVTTIGMVGYPNVGKSSTINALMTVKKVSVSATPGKTKRFQTLFLRDDLMLCDCPGLVMPSFVLTKADMLLNGILPIDQMRDHIPAITLICERIPRHVLEDKYGIVIAKPLETEDPDRPPTAEEILLAYGYNRGFMTSNGQPDQARSARYICKDYVSGKLLYCVPPPDVPIEQFQSFPARQRKQICEDQLPIQQQRAMRILTPNQEAAKNFKLEEERNRTAEIQKLANTCSNNAYVKGRSDFPNVRLTNDGNMLIQQGLEPPSKPWRSVKKERRQKLRNKFSHLDEH